MKIRLRSRLAGLLLAALAICTLIVINPTASRAVTAADWNPGSIISDAKFFDGNAMSATDVQSFLSNVGTGCTAGAMPCLKDYSSPTSATPAESSLCAAMPATGSSTAAQIIDMVARACGISQKVIIATLQKESGLVLGSQLTAINYRSATGMGCPDTAPCDAQYFGFFNQVYQMSRQFKIYTAYPTQYGYQKGRYNTIQYNPNTGCGSSSVYIDNQATANLYIYTPYQPNAASLANLGGTGDGCSAYGNRNFWNFYNNWFGSTQDQPAIDPRGAMSVSLSSSGTISISGWAFDMSDPYSPVTVMVMNNGANVGLIAATGPRPELANFGVPGNHGFTYSYTAPSPTGNNQVCLLVFNIGGGSNQIVQCVTVAQPINPQGAMNLSTSPTGLISIDGWAFDLSTPADPINVMLTKDGVSQGLMVAAGPRPELASFGVPGNHGFATTVQGPASGSSSICLFVFNTAGGSDQIASCQLASVPAVNPQGYLSASMSDSGLISLSGYSFDLNSPGTPLNMMVTTNGQVTSILNANGPRPELAYYGIPGNHGYSVQYQSPTSNQADVCVYAFNVGPGDNVVISCQTVQPPQIDPQAALALSVSGKTITANGWAFDMSAPNSPVTVMLTLNGQIAAYSSASGPRPELAAFGVPGSHGFNVPITATKTGSNQVCLYAFNIGGGNNILASCQNVNV